VVVFRDEKNEKTGLHRDLISVELIKPADQQNT
jgi:hypothetical protein